MSEIEQSDAVVVGGGLAGLTASIYLAQAGKSVTLLEKADQLGGRAQTTNKNGALFNMGPHALFTKGAAIQILSELGCKPSGGSPANKMLGMREGKLVKLPTDFSSLLSSKAFTIGEKLEFIKIMSSFLKIVSADWMGKSLQDWMQSQVRHKRVRDYFYALFRMWTYGGAPNEQSAGYAIKQGQLALQGILYVNGGWQSLVDSLRTRAIKSNVRIMKSCKAEQVVHQDGKVQALQLSGGDTVKTNAVIVAAGPEEACRLIEGSERISLGQWKREAVPLFGACLDLTLKNVPYPKREFAIGIDEPVYFSNHSAVIPISSNGGTVIHVMKYKGNHADSDPRVDERQLTQLLDRLQPGWDKEVMDIRYLPNMLISYDSRSFRKQGSAVAPKPSVEEIKGLYVAGDWVGAEGRLAETALTSAKKAATDVKSLV